MGKLVKVAGINLALLLGVVLAAELIFGGWIGANYGTLVIPRDFKRQFDVGHLYDNGGEPTLYIRDDHGLRGDYGEPSAIDILTIGGSTTNEIFVTEGNTWSDVLARTFAEEGKKVTVANAGVDGQTTIGHLKNFELWFPLVPRLKPRWVVAYIGINDLGLALSGHLNKQDHLEARQRGFKQYLMNNSAIYTLFRNVRGMIRARRADLVHSEDNPDGAEWLEAVPPPNIAAAEREMAEHLEVYGQRVQALAAAVREFGAEPIFVTQQGGRYRVKDGRVLGRKMPDGSVDTDVYAGLTAFNRRTMQACGEAKAVCIDLARDLEFTDGDFYDGLHTTPRGSEKIGRYLHSRLAALIGNDGL